jgi:histidinol dehydrogenase
MKIKIIKADGTAERNALATLAGRDTVPERDVEDAVREILEDVRRRGDTAVREYSVRFDGYAPEQAFVSREEMKTAFESVDETFREAIMAAAANIRSYHEKQVSEGYEEKRADGVVLGQMVRGLSRVGLYVPGGTAAYPSTVLMNGIPAKLAGVERLVMVTPPRREQDDAILAAAWVAGVDEVVYYGGAQAIAALAYGTESLPRVDKIVGPGNVYVATAKRLIYGLCDIDMIAGPSEILIIADENANPDWIAADLLSQAEHDKNAAAILLTTDEELADCVSEQIEKRLSLLPRRDIAAVSIQNNGLIILCRSADEMVSLANLAAPEHLEILTEDPLALVPAIRNAGSVFCGPWSPEPLGDYYAGTNHVLPTSGTARFASPLGVYDFIKRMSYTYYTKEALAAAKAHIVAIGEAEGLTAHTEAVKARFD